MRTTRLVVVIALVLAASAVWAEGNAKQSFAALKALSGSWAGKASNGQAVRVSFRVTSNGSAIMSEIQSEDDMISMFHLDGDRLLMTHYCGAGNQPRMQAAVSPDGKTFDFTFVDSTNLPSPSTGHMHRMTLKVLDENHHTEEWTFLQDGKEMKEVFDLQRKN